jgi:hypothetical protein
MRPSGKCILEFHPTFRRLPSNDRSSFLAPATEKSKVASRTEHQAAFVKPDDDPWHKNRSLSLIWSNNIREQAMSTSAPTSGRIGSGLVF